MSFGIFAPSSRVDRPSLSEAEKRATAHGMACHIHPQTYKTHHQSAGSAADKAAALSDLINNNDIDALWAAVGGNRSASILDHIDHDFIASCTKPLIGFSDVTYLLHAFYTLSGRPQIHAPTLQTISNERITDDDILALKKMVNACVNKEAITLDFDGISPIPSAVQDITSPFEGTIIGGNLSLLQSLIGTPYMPDDADFILFIEDIGDQLSRYDRMLRHLSHSGLLRRCRAILIGDMACARDQSRTPFDFTPDEIYAEHFGGLDALVIKDMPFGHRGPLQPLPVGARTTAQMTKENGLSLHIRF